MKKMIYLQSRSSELALYSLAILSCFAIHKICRHFTTSFVCLFLHDTGSIFGGKFTYPSVFQHGPVQIVQVMMTSIAVSFQFPHNLQQYLLNDGFHLQTCKYTPVIVCVNYDTMCRWRWILWNGSVSSVTNLEVKILWKTL